MKNDILKLIAAPAFVLSLLATPALAVEFSELDSDNNDQISRDEFYGSVADTGTYSDWDTSNDGLIDESEFGSLGQDWDYDAWDADANGYVDSGEFYDGYYASYDSSEDGHWDSGDWDDAGEAGLFDW